MKNKRFSILSILKFCLFTLSIFTAEQICACTRVVYQGKDGVVLTGRPICQSFVLCECIASYFRYATGCDGNFQCYT